MISIGEPYQTQLNNRDGSKRSTWALYYVDLAGKRRRVFAKTEAAIKQRAEELKAELYGGVHIAHRISFADAAQEALQARSKLVGKKNGIRPQTFGNDERHLRLYLVPHFGDKKMRAITTGEINLYIDAMAADEMSPKTQRHIIATLNMVCKHAVAKGYLISNPCSKDERQEIRGSMGERKGYHADEVQALLAQPMATQTRAIIMTAAFTGLAANELQGLTWKDVDLYSGTLSVERTGYRYMVQDETKTEYRRRTVPLPSALIRVLREWQLQCHSATWCFPTVNGRMGEQNAWRKVIATVCRHAGVEDKGLGGFRKFYHTQMEMAGVPESIRKYRMGHSKKSNTAKIHYTDADIKVAMSVADIETIAAKFAP